MSPSSNDRVSPSRVTRFGRLACCALLWLLVPPVATQERPNPSGGVLTPERAAYDVTAYDLSLAVDPDSRRIDGTLEMTARLVGAAEELRLDLDGRLRVDAVRFDGRDVLFSHGDGRIMIPVPAAAQQGSEFTLEVDYGGAPRVAPRPPWDGGFTWARTADGSPWIATSCQGEGADLWWPCKDHPSDKPERFDLRIRVPTGLIVASNGRMLSETGHDDGTTTFHWHLDSPVSNYAVALNIAPYEVLSTDYTSVTGEDMPFLFWVLPENAEQGRGILPEFADHMRFYEELLGPYPFRSEKYGVVETPHLGMEHQTIIAYGNRYRRTGFDYDWLHHHELAHEWWGNLVTCRDWKDMWLHEGFGTYMQALYLESRFGPEAYAKEMGDKRASLNNRRAVAQRRTRDSKQVYFFSDGQFDNDIYMKGSWVLHSLRWLLGDEVFFEGLRRFAYPTEAHANATDGSQVRLVDTEDCRAIFEQVSGRDLGWFFDVYVRQPHLPRLEHHVNNEAQLTLQWETVLGEPFPMPVPVRIGGSGAEREIVRVEMPGGRAVIGPVWEGRAPVLDKPEIDPERRLLRWEYEFDNVLLPNGLKRVLLVGIDGCRPDALMAADTPVLDRLMANGAASLVAQTCAETSSGPSWSSLLTASWPDKHGVLDNDFAGARLDRHPPVFERAKSVRAELATASLVHWAPIHEHLAEGSDLSLSLDSDAAVAQRAVELLSDGDPDLLFLHFDEVDGAGHASGYGPDVPEYVAAIEQVDALLGQVVAALDERAAAHLWGDPEEDWLILVTTDHGGTDTGHGEDIPEHRTIFVIVSGDSAARGEIVPPPTIVDVGATILGHLGIEPMDSWELDGRPIGLER